MRRHRPRSSGPHQPRRPRWRRDAPVPRAAPDGAARLSAGAGILYGWHTVKAALENPARRIRHLYATANAARRLADDGVALPVQPEVVRPDAIARRLGPDAVHNGLLAEADALPSPELEQIEPAGLVLVLDQITDPHNVGAILRTAAAFGVKAVVITARHSPDATGVLAKSASGALEYVPLDDGLSELARVIAPGGHLLHLPVHPGVAGVFLEILFRFKSHPPREVITKTERHFRIIHRYKFPAPQAIGWSKTAIMAQKV